MPKRVVSVDGTTGEWRCDDVACKLLQCWVCDKEQRKDARTKAAAIEKQLMEEMAVQEVRLRLAAGHQFDFTEPVQPAVVPVNNENNAAKSKKRTTKAATKYKLQRQADDLELEYEEAEQGDAFTAVIASAEAVAPPANAEQLATSSAAIASAEAVAPPANAEELAASSAAIANAEAEAPPANTDKKTKWNHSNRMLVYGWIARNNPFKVARGKTTEAWDAIAIECKKATQHLSVKDGRIDLSGHDIQVWIGKQLKPDSKFFSWRRQLAAEATQSGQTGQLSNHETKEYDLLAQILDLKNNVQAEREAAQETKAKSEAIKNGQMNDEIYQWAMASEVQRPQALRTLNKKRKEISIKMQALKDAGAKTAEEQVAKLSESDRNALRLWERYKTENSSAADDYDSDENANRSGKKRRTLEQSIQAISQMGATMAQLATAPNATELALQRYLEFKMARGVDELCPQRAAPPSQEPTSQLRNLQSRLKFLSDARKEGIITEEEHDEQRRAMISESFKR
jgi:hypothetical protein